MRKASASRSACYWNGGLSAMTCSVGMRHVMPSSLQTMKSSPLNAFSSNLLFSAISKPRLFFSENSFISLSDITLDLCENCIIEKGCFWGFYLALFTIRSIVHIRLRIFILLRLEWCFMPNVLFDCFSHITHGF